MHRLRDAKKWNGWSHNHVWWINIGRDTSGVRGHSSLAYHQAQGSSAREITSITFGYQKQWGLGQWKKLQDSQESPLKWSTMDLGHIQTHSLWASTPGQELAGYRWSTGIN